MSPRNMRVGIEKYAEEYKLEGSMVAKRIQPTTERNSRSVGRPCHDYCACNAIMRESDTHSAACRAGPRTDQADSSRIGAQEERDAK